MSKNGGSDKRREVAAGQIDHVGVPLWRASMEFTRRMIESVQHRGFDDISIADSELLPFLDIEGTGLSEIAERKGVSRQAIHQSVHSLVKRGYLELVPDPEDARAKIARHADKGLRLVAAMQEIKSDMQHEALSALGQRKTAELTRMLDILATTFANASEK